MANRLSAEKWAGFVRQWEVSGQSARAFAAAHGLADASLRWWKTELARRSKTTAAPTPMRQTRPVLARVVREGEPSPMPEVARGVVALVIGSVRIEIERGFDPTLLRAVVQALGGAQS